MKTLKILSEREFQKISKNKAVWYEKITLNGAKFTCVVVNGDPEEYYIEIEKLVGKSVKQYVQVPLLIWEALYDLIEKVHDNTY